MLKSSLDLQRLQSRSSTRLSLLSWLFAVGILSAAMGLVSGVLTAHSLGVSGRGELALALLAVGLVSSLGDFGITSAITLIASRRPGAIWWLWTRLRTLSLSLTMVCAIPFGSLNWLLLHDSMPVMRNALGIGLAYLYLNFYLRGCANLATATGDYGTVNMIKLLLAGSYTLMAAGIWVSAEASVELFLIANLVSNILVIWAARRRIRKRLATKTSNEQVTVRELVRTGVSTHLAGIGLIDNLQLDLMLVGLLLGAEDAGVYSVAMAGALLLKMVSSSAGLVVLPEMAAQPLVDRWAYATKAIKRVSQLSIPLLIVLVLGSRPVIELVYGSEFEPAAAIVWTLGPVTLLGVFRKVVSDLNRACGGEVASSVAEVVGASVGGAVGFVTSSRMGLQGIVLAVGAANVVSLLMVTINFRSRSRGGAASQGTEVTA